MKRAKKYGEARLFVWAATGVTALYEILVSSPWWLGGKHGRYDMLIQLTIPSIFLILFAYFLLSKKLRQYAMAISVYIVFLHLAVGFTIFAAARGVLP